MIAAIEMYSSGVANLHGQPGIQRHALRAVFSFTASWRCLQIFSCSFWWISFSLVHSHRFLGWMLAPQEPQASFSLSNLVALTWENQSRKTGSCLSLSAKLQFRARTHSNPQKKKNIHDPSNPSKPLQTHQFPSRETGERPLPQRIGLDPPHGGVRCIFSSLLCVCFLFSTAFFYWLIEILLCFKRTMNFLSYMTLCPPKKNAEKNSSNPKDAVERKTSLDSGGLKDKTTHIHTNKQASKQASKLAS